MPIPTMFYHQTEIRFLASPLLFFINNRADQLKDGGLLLPRQRRRSTGQDVDGNPEQPNGLSRLDFLILYSSFLIAAGISGSKHPQLVCFYSASVTGFYTAVDTLWRISFSCLIAAVRFFSLQCRMPHPNWNFPIHCDTELYRAEGISQSRYFC